MVIVETSDMSKYKCFFFNYCIFVLRLRIENRFLGDGIRNPISFRQYSFSSVKLCEIKLHQLRKLFSTIILSIYFHTMYHGYQFPVYI